MMRAGFGPSAASRNTVAASRFGTRTQRRQHCFAAAGGVAAVAGGVAAVGGRLAVSGYPMCACVCVCVCVCRWV